MYCIEGMIIREHRSCLTQLYMKTLDSVDIAVIIISQQYYIKYHIFYYDL